MTDRQTDRQTGYPSLDKPWLKYYTRTNHYMLSSDMGMYDFLLLNNKSSLENIALNFYGKKTTYKQLISNIDAVASALKNYGVEKGDVVSLCALNIPEFYYLLYAVNKIGAVSNIVGLSSPVEDLHDQLAASDSKIVFTVSLAFEQIAIAAKGTKINSIISVPVEQSMPLVLKAILNVKNRRVNNTGIQWKDFIKGETAKTESVVNGDDLAIIIYTGGSTGIPKGVMLSNKALNSYYINFRGTNDQGVSCYKRQDSYLCCVPLFLAFGVSACCHGPLCHGMELVLTPDPSPASVADAVLKYKPNHLVAGPPLVETLIKKAEKKKQDLSFIKSIMYGGEATSQEWEIEYERRFKERNADVPICNGYGMTETSAAILISAKGLTNLIPLCNVNVRVADPEDYNIELGYDEEGELLLSSETLMMGYYNYKEESDEVLVQIDGNKWIRTNDLARISRDGEISITGRIKRLYYKLDADNVPLRVYPMRIENVIEGVPCVLKSAVVGVKDDITAYRSVAYVILSDELVDNSTAKAMIEAECRESLANHQWPDEYIFVKEFPVTRAGKVDYRALEKMATDDFSERKD